MTTWEQAVDVVSGFLSDNAASDPMGIAVSGGSDSLALLLILKDWADGAGRSLHAVTVDHGLRPEAAEEAAFVAGLCADLTIDHTILRWDGPAPTGNISDQARQARYALMDAWAQDRGIDQIAVGHTADDQAETLLMRLGRGAGVDGLATMATRRRIGQTDFLRPMLTLRRDALQDLLKQRGQTWINDPTNDNPDYDRVRIRQAMPTLSDIGLSVDALTTTAANLAQARDALAHYAVQEAAKIVTQDAAGDILIDHDAWTHLSAEIARRLIQAGLHHVAGPGYPPRSKALQQLINHIHARTPMTLAGCIVQTDKTQIRITREPAAVPGPVPADHIWDTRWQMTGPVPDGAEIAALTEGGLKACPDWRDTGLKRTSLLSTPAIWLGDRLISAPIAGNLNGFQAKLLRTRKDFDAALRTH
ncbi:tRNA lysidine(34) synthetase TilS [Pseudooceanicola sp. MF1-13]|uniref:tRNA lysidine(34) synthetase TilS n=1 Tax=Pseudooceanicola sp. MF1-13 TaxID=3379095 RepID=UPI0038916937